MSACGFELFLIIKLVFRFLLKDGFFDDFYQAEKTFVDKWTKMMKFQRIRKNIRLMTNKGK